MRRYRTKEVFDTFQGEGARAGCRSVFVRLAGCNLWSGREADRGRFPAACARFCDTDFVGGDRTTAEEIADRVDAEWAPGGERWAVITGGEPLLQVDVELLSALVARGIRVAVETNGTIAVLPEVRALVSHLVVSPKRGAPLLQTEADELKVVLPGGWSDAEVDAIAASGEWVSRFVQPEAPPGGGLGDPARCLAFARARPEWRVSIQAHKVMGLR